MGNNSVSPDSIFSISFSFFFKGIQSSIAYNDFEKLCPLVSVVKQWNGIKETNTATGRDKEFKKKMHWTDWSQSREINLIWIYIPPFFRGYSWSNAFALCANLYFVSSPYLKGCNFSKVPSCFQCKMQATLKGKSLLKRVYLFPFRVGREADTSLSDETFHVIPTI